MVCMPFSFSIVGCGRFHALFLRSGGAIAEGRDLVQIIEQDLLYNLLNRLICILVELLHVLFLEENLGSESRPDDHIFIATILQSLEISPTLSVLRASIALWMGEPVFLVENAKRR